MPVTTTYDLSGCGCCGRIGIDCCPNLVPRRLCLSIFEYPPRPDEASCLWGVYPLEYDPIGNAGVSPAWVWEGSVCGLDDVKIVLFCNPDFGPKWGFQIFSGGTPIAASFHGPTDFVPIDPGTCDPVGQTGGVITSEFGGIHVLQFELTEGECGEELMMTGAKAAVRRPAARKALPCVHEGHTCPPPAGAKPNRTYLGCDAGRGVNGVVCRCDCNPACEGYDPAD